MAGSKKPNKLEPPLLVPIALIVLIGIIILWLV